MRGLIRLSAIRDAELDGLRAEVEAASAYFSDWTFRQDHPLSPHGDTQTLYLRMPETLILPDGMFDDLTCVDLPLMRRPMFAWAVDHVACWAAGDKKPARVMIVRLKAGGRIARHTDEGAYAEATRRYHLAISTNPDCVMEVDGGWASAPAGTVWFFDKSLPHQVFNLGVTHRDHLIVDVWK